MRVGVKNDPCDLSKVRSHARTGVDYAALRQPAVAGTLLHRRIRRLWHEQIAPGNSYPRHSNHAAILSFQRQLRIPSNVDTFVRFSQQKIPPLRLETCILSA